MWRGSFFFPVGVSSGTGCWRCKAMKDERVMGVFSWHRIAGSKIICTLAWLLLYNLEIPSGLVPDFSNCSQLVCLSFLLCCFAAGIPSSITNHIQTGLQEQPPRPQSFITGALGMWDSNSVLDKRTKQLKELIKILLLFRGLAWLCEVQWKKSFGAFIHSLPKKAVWIGLATETLLSMLLKL